MKIDIHTHTRRCKSGDAASREVSPDVFCEAVSATDVKIVAITNHNVFDFSQFKEIQQRLTGGIQVWPGVELDIVEGASRGHLLVIVAPDEAHRFDARVANLCSSATPDTFAASIEDVVRAFDDIGPLYIAHYGQKKPDLSDEALEALVNATHFPSRVLREVTNAISAGIYISHGYASIYGSDVHDWKHYGELAAELPELRLPVDSFDQFCLLLEKDAATITTALDRKTSEELMLQPFGDGAFLKLTVYNDINVVFGAKGTGKSCILKAIEKHYVDNGIDAKVFTSASDRLEELFDLKGKNLQLELSKHGISECRAEIRAVCSASEKDVTALSGYVKHFASQVTNRNAKRLRLKDVDVEEVGGLRREFEDAVDAADQTRAFIGLVAENTAIRGELQPAELGGLEAVLNTLVGRLEARSWDRFASWKTVEMMNSAVKLFRREVARKTGSPAKPTTTGFSAFAANRCRIDRDTRAILGAIATVIPTAEEVVGSLGDSKGELSLRTEIRFHDGNPRDKALAPCGRVKKTAQKSFVEGVKAVAAAVYREDLFECIARLHDEDAGGVKTTRDLLLFKKYFALNGKAYTPSSGEGSMVMLEKELKRDADIYILDEPERSLGNEYISEVVVPLIKGHARAGKRVFISTHDANIAVRTLPYCAVYRSHGIGGYATYVGNPFSNELVSVTGSSERLNWKEVSMRTLEGGEAAFGERGKIYGNA